MISHKNMNLFDAPKDSIIIHACNSQGMWGSGIAKSFAQNYPESYSFYQGFCKANNQERGSACGLADMSPFPVSEQHWVGWIVTSHDYGPKKDSPEQIKIYTTMALQELCRKLYLAHPKEQYPVIDVYSNKFNSGLFNVPWEDSELILGTVLKNYKRINWIICDPDMR